jgi:predicted site-specific integrase-resolvase
MWFSTTKLAKLEKVTTQTIRRKIDAGAYEKVEKTDGGHYRIFVKSEKVITYGRIISAKQKTSLVTQQERLLEQFPKSTFISDTSSSFNFKRKGLCSILEQAMSGTSIHLVATTQDRIARSGFEIIRKIIELSGGTIELLEKDNNPKEKFDTTELIGFITSFCNSYYGKRSATIRKDNSHKKDKNIS